MKSPRYIGLKLFGLYTVILIIGLLLSSTISRGQTAQDYLREFKNDAFIHNRSIGPITPTIRLVTVDLYIDQGDGPFQVDGYTNFIASTIYLDTKSYMYKYNLKVLVYHELAHYYLKRSHTQELSIMNVDIWSEKEWDTLPSDEQEYYIWELFKLK